MIYIAGPFFNDNERNELNKMISYVRETHPDEELFIPMEHFIPGGEKMTNAEWGNKVFELDVKAIDDCDEVFALYLGHYSDTGTAWEIGYAFAKQKKTTLWIPENVEITSVMPMNSANLILSKIIIEQK